MMSGSLTLTLSASIPDDRLAKLTHDLEHDLSRAGIQVNLTEAPQVRGEKGEPITLGVLALALISHGAVTAIIECFKAYISRERALTIKLSSIDGAAVEITERNIDTVAVRETLRALASVKR